jgi:hypothetical protein
MPPPCPPCDQPDTSLQRLVLMGKILCADETLLALLADVLQQTGWGHLSEKPTVPPGWRQKGTSPRLRRFLATECS